MFEISLEDQIAAVAREISFRERLYPRWVEQKKLTQKTADLEVARMRAVRETLVNLQAPAGLQAELHPTAEERN